MCMFSPSRPHYMTSTNLSNIRPEMMLKLLKTRQLWSLPLPSPFLLTPHAFCFPLFLLFSLLNCKYQVPFILFCYFCYCYYIVLVIFFFSSRPAQQQPDCLSSVAVCKYDFISVPGSGGKKQNKMFHFYSLSLHFSLQDFPFSLISVVITVLFIVSCFFGGEGGGSLAFHQGGKIEGYVCFFLFNLF